MIIQRKRAQFLKDCPSLSLGHWYKRFEYLSKRPGFKTVVWPFGIAFKEPCVSARFLNQPATAV